MQTKLNAYAGVPLDRAAHRRKDPDWLAAARAAPDARVLPVWRTRSLVAGPPDAPRATLLPAAVLGDEELILLGVMGDAAVFAADLSALEEPAEHPALRGLGEFQDLRATGPLMPAGEAALCAYARGMVWWSARHRFCGVCGAPAAPAEGGHVRVCTNPACGVHHFPRTDPAVIMLVHDGRGNMVLGRQAAWPPGMHSVLAGFVEPGESLEEAVAREVFEEVGIRVTDVTYHSSQPWPFPSSLMLGFRALAASTDLDVHRDELESAQWVGRERLRTLDLADETLRLARVDSIARRMIDEWIAEG